MSQPKFRLTEYRTLRELNPAREQGVGSQIPKLNFAREKLSKSKPLRSAHHQPQRKEHGNHLKA
jgi:hypothetical protein